MALTKLNNKSVANVSTLPVALGDMVLVSSATASGSANIDFTLGNYKEYQFYFVNMHPSSDNISFQMNFSTDNGSNYNVTKTSTYFEANHGENDASSELVYQPTQDLAQSTGYETLCPFVGNDNDQNCSGYLHLFNPSSTTYVKHYLSVLNNVNAGDYDVESFKGGYANTTSPLTNIRFKFDSGNIDSGTILMYGLN